LIGLVLAARGRLPLVPPLALTLVQKLLPPLSSRILALFHDSRAIVTFCGEAVMSTAIEGNILCCRLASFSVGFDVVKLQPARLCAAPAARIDEGALLPIAGHHSSLDLSRDVSRPLS
jgi:hypothetical protein